MARRSTPPTTLPPQPCSRSQWLEERDQCWEQRAQWFECRKIDTLPGYETLARMKYDGGN